MEDRPPAVPAGEPPNPEMLKVVRDLIALGEEVLAGLDRAVSGEMEEAERVLARDRDRALAAIEADLAAAEGKASPAARLVTGADEEARVRRWGDYAIGRADGYREAMEDAARSRGRLARAVLRVRGLPAAAAHPGARARRRLARAVRAPWGRAWGKARAVRKGGGKAGKSRETGGRRI